MVKGAVTRMSRKVDAWLTGAPCHYGINLAVVLLNSAFIDHSHVREVIDNREKSERILPAIPIPKLSDRCLCTGPRPADVSFESCSLARLDQDDSRSWYGRPNVPQLLHIAEARDNEGAVELIPVAPHDLARNDVMPKLIKRSQREAKAFLVINAQWLHVKRANDGACLDVTKSVLG